MADAFGGFAESMFEIIPPSFAEVLESSVFDIFDSTHAHSFACMN
jgi:hypothetical protein